MLAKKLTTAACILAFDTPALLHSRPASRSCPSPPGNNKRKTQKLLGCRRSSRLSAAFDTANARRGGHQFRGPGISRRSATWDASLLREGSVGNAFNQERAPTRRTAAKSIDFFDRRRHAPTARTLRRVEGDYNETLGRVAFEGHDGVGANNIAPTERHKPDGSACQHFAEGLGVGYIRDLDHHIGERRALCMQAAKQRATDQNTDQDSDQQPPMICHRRTLLRCNATAGMGVLWVSAKLPKR